jgi:hypothetical protein
MLAANQYAKFVHGHGPPAAVYGGNLGRDFGLFTTRLSPQMGPTMRAMNYVTPTAVAHGGMGQVQRAW